MEFPFLLIQRSQLCKSVQAKYILFILELSGIYHTYCSYLFIHPSVNIITYHKSFTFTLFYSHYLVLLLMLFILALLLSVFCVVIKKLRNIEINIYINNTNIKIVGLRTSIDPCIERHTTVLTLFIIYK